MKEQMSRIEFQIHDEKTELPNSSHSKGPLGLEFINSDTGLCDTFIYRQVAIWDSKK